MEMLDINRAESILLALLEEDSDCVPVLNNIGHMYGRYLSEWETAIEYYDRVCLLYTSPSPRDQRGSRMPSSA